MHGSANKLSSRVALSASLLSLGAALALASPALAGDAPLEGAIKSLAPTVNSAVAPTQADARSVASEVGVQAPATPAAGVEAPLRKFTPAPVAAVVPKVVSKTVEDTLDKLPPAAAATVTKTVMGTVKQVTSVAPSPVTRSASSTITRVASTVPAGVTKTVGQLTAPVTSGNASTVVQTVLASTAGPVQSTVSGALTATSISSLPIVGRTVAGTPKPPVISLPGGSAPEAATHVDAMSPRTIDQPVGATQEAPAPAAAGGASGGPLAAGQLPSGPSAEVLDTRSAHMSAQLPAGTPQGSTGALLSLQGTVRRSMGANPSGSSDSPAQAPFSPQPGPAGVPSGAGAPAGASGGLTLFTLAGLLMAGALWAMRRLRIASDPLRPAPFVLIPDRPG